MNREIYRRGTLQAYAAEAACEWLLDNWSAAKRGGNLGDFSGDVDAVIEYLQTFRDKAAQILSKQENAQLSTNSPADTQGAKG